MAITNANIKMMKNGVALCPSCKKFFGTKKLSEDMLALVNKYGVCPACIEKMNIEEDNNMEVANQEAQAAEVEETKFEVKNVKAKRIRANTITIPEEGDSRIIIAGPRGVTKHQMIDAITRNVDNPDNIKQLMNDYPATFAGSLRYVKKNVRDAVTAIVGDINAEAVDEEKFELLQILKPKRKGVTYNQIIIALEHACESNDLELITKLHKHFPEQFKGSLRYMGKKYHETLEKALELSTNEKVSIKKLAARKA